MSAITPLPLWAQMLGVRGVVDAVEDDDGEIAGLIVSARLRKAEAGRWASAAGGAVLQDCPYLTVSGKPSWPVIAASDTIT